MARNQTGAFSLKPSIFVRKEAKPNNQICD